MAAPESQLTTWVNQGAVATAQLTDGYIQNVLNSHTGWPSAFYFEIYLQGSYKNR